MSMAMVHAYLVPSGGEYWRLKEEREKTIPFLRQLTDMLQNNEELISFVPGQRSSNKIIHGKIIIHDRSRVQAEVLPAYFSHASFASLRRQLSYFSFVRVGKSRQSGVTYTNEAVVELSDILRLKRRTSGGASKQQAGDAFAKQQQRMRQNAQQPQQFPPLQLQEQQRTTTLADDVASAVLSGTIHANKTNQNLDINSTSTTNEGSDQAMFNPPNRSSNSNGTAQSSLSESTASSNSSSDAVSDNGKGGVVDNNYKSGTYNSKNPKLKQMFKRKGSSSIAKHPIPRKDRARLDKLLSHNNIVPFIHLPSRHTMRPRAKREESTVQSTVTGRRSNGERTNNHQGSVFQRENAPEAGRERSTSDCAINALLALGSDRQ